MFPLCAPSTARNTGAGVSSRAPVTSASCVLINRSATLRALITLHAQAINRRVAHSIQHHRRSKIRRLRIKPHVLQ